MTSQFLIASYSKDFVWLEPCLKALKKFMRDFLPPVVCVETKDAPECRRIAARTFPETLVKIKDGREGQGFMRAQCAMMNGDVLCPRADFIFLLGSDCLATRPFGPEVCLGKSGKPILWIKDYASMIAEGHPAQCWQERTTRVLGFEPKYEYMQRLPLAYPRGLFAPTRAYVSGVHGMPFEDYIYTADAEKPTASESNILGAYAHHFSPQMFEWLDVSTVEQDEKHPVGKWDNPILQMWSHGGLDKAIDAPAWYEYLPGKNAYGKLPRDVIKEVLSQ